MFSNNFSSANCGASICELCKLRWIQVILIFSSTFNTYFKLIYSFNLGNLSVNKLNCDDRNYVHVNMRVLNSTRTLSSSMRQSSDPSRHRRHRHLYYYCLGYCSGNCSDAGLYLGSAVPKMENERITLISKGKFTRKCSKAHDSPYHYYHSLHSDQYSAVHWAELSTSRH